jgi:hypothetical protein
MTEYNKHSLKDFKQNMRLILFHKIPYNIDTAKQVLPFISLKWARIV